MIKEKPELIEVSGKPHRGAALFIGTSTAAEIQIPDVGTVGHLHATIRRKLTGSVVLEAKYGYPTRIERDGRSFQVFSKGAELLDGDVVRCGGHVRIRWTEAS